MAKAKKQKEEFVKLDMSFEDAMRLAMKTSPAFMLKLNVGEKTEIPNVSKRVLEFVTLQLIPPDEYPEVELNASSFFIVPCIVYPDDKTFNLHPILSRIDPYQKNTVTGIFAMPNGNPTITIEKDGKFLGSQSFVLDLGASSKRW